MLWKIMRPQFCDARRPWALWWSVCGPSFDVLRRGGRRDAPEELLWNAAAVTVPLRVCVRAAMGWGGMAGMWTSHALILGALLGALGLPAILILVFLYYFVAPGNSDSMVLSVTREENHHSYVGAS